MSSKVKVVTVLIVSLIIQYALMNSHKAGSSHWPLVAGTSFFMFLIGLFFTSKLNSNSRWSFGFFVGALISLLLPAAAYVFMEWKEVPNSVANSFNQSGVDYLLMMIIFSGGWIYAAGLFLCRTFLLTQRGGDVRS